MGTGMPSVAQAEPTFHHANLPGYAAGSTTSGHTSTAPASKSSIDAAAASHRSPRQGASVHQHQSSVASSLDFGNMSSSPTKAGEEAEGGKKRKRNTDDNGSDDEDEFPTEADHGRDVKFLVLEDKMKGGSKTRVKFRISHVKMGEIPDSFRKNHSVYYRAFAPAQMPDLRDEQVQRTDGRYVDDSVKGPSAAGDAETVKDAGSEMSVTGRTMITLTCLHGGEAKADLDEGHGASGRSHSAIAGASRDIVVALPRLSGKKWRKEKYLNDLGYKMIWNQNRVFAGRLLFLQRSLDSYRKKIRSNSSQPSSSKKVSDGTRRDSTASGGAPPENPIFLTRVGRSRWQDGKGRSKQEDEALAR